MIPITTVRFDDEIESLVLDVLRSGSIAQGPRVEQFEEAFAELSGAKHAVAVNNGTTALVAALEVLDLGPGDEVVTSPFTFVATLNAILETGATARFADITAEDFNLDASTIAPVLSDRTRVLLPVHLYGQMADMDPIAAIAAEHGLDILEDSAQSHGATYRGRPAGSYGLGTFSFYATKNITTGEGGIITTDDDERAHRLRVLRNQGMRARYVYEVAGHNYRLTDLQAAVGLPQIARYTETVDARNRNAARLIEGLEGTPGLVVPRIQEGRNHVWHQFTVRVTPEARISRDEFVVALQAQGIGCGVYYPKLLGDYEAYQNHPRVVIDETPVARKVASEVVSLPVHTALSEEDITTIIGVVRSTLGAD